MREVTVPEQALIRLCRSNKSSVVGSIPRIGFGWLLGFVANEFVMMSQQWSTMLRVRAP
jgi:hypothetical protein